VFQWDVTAPGQVPPNPLPIGNGGSLLAAAPGADMFDSLAVDGEGWVCIGTLGSGGITSVSPDGSKVEHLPLPDPLVTNVCFGGPDLRTAFVTLSGTGLLVSLDWPRKGLRLAHTA
jgi:gluconolactonase